MAEKLPEGAGARAGVGAVKHNTLPPLSGMPIPDTKLGFEWVEQDGPGVYITLTALPGGARDLKRIRFRRFSETQAEQWWQENRARVYQQYSVRVVDKSVAESEWVEQDEPGRGVPYLNGYNGLFASNGPSSVRSKTHVEVGKNGTKLPDSDTKLVSEWVEQDEPGIYITLAALPEGARDIKRVRFSRKRFSETQAEQWWGENRARVYQQYNVRVLGKSLT